jgi:hypothetical protein
MASRMRYVSRCDTCHEGRRPDSTWARAVRRGTYRADATSDDAVKAEGIGDAL